MKEERRAKMQEKKAELEQLAITDQQKYHKAKKLKKWCVLSYLICSVFWWLPDHTRNISVHNVVVTCFWPCFPLDCQFVEQTLCCSIVEQHIYFPYPDAYGWEGHHLEEEESTEDQIKYVVAEWTIILHVYLGQDSYVNQEGSDARDNEIQNGCIKWCVFAHMTCINALALHPLHNFYFVGEQFVGPFELLSELIFDFFEIIRVLFWDSADFLDVWKVSRQEIQNIP